MASIQATGADVVKFATTALDITDVRRVFQITVHSQVSRVCSILVHSNFIFRSANINLICFKSSLLLLTYHVSWLNGGFMLQNLEGHIHELF